MRSLWELAEQVTSMEGLRVCLLGAPGIGKSRLARGSGRSVFSLTLTEGTSMSELRGHFTLRGMEAIWHPGLVARAWGESHLSPTVLVLDELDHASLESWSFLLQALDDHPSVLLPTGEVIAPASSLTVISTANSLEGVPVALRDRFPITLTLPGPHPAIAALLPPKVAALPLGTRQKLTFLTLIRTGMEIGDILRLFFPAETAEELSRAWIMNSLGPAGSSRPERRGK